MYQNIKTFEDVLQTVKANPELYKHLLPADTTLEDFIKYPGNRLELIVAVLNEGWKPDWSNSNEYKYMPWFYMNPDGFSFSVCGYDCTISDVGSRLCFKSRELTEYAGKQFEAEYKEYMLIK